MYFRLSKFFLFATPFTVALITTSTLFPFIVGKYVFFRTMVDLSAIFFLLGLVLEGGAEVHLARLKKVLLSPLGITISLFTVIFLLAGFFGVNPSFSFWSNFERGEGGFQMLHLYALFLLMATLFRDEADWKRLFTLSLLAALMMVAYGLLAGTNLPGFIGSSFSENGYRFAGSVGNPAYAAIYLIFISCYAGYLLLFSRERARSARSMIYILALLVFLAFFFLAATRGAFLGLVGGLLAALAYLGFSHPRARKWLFGLGAALVIVVALLVQLKDTSFVRAIPGSRVFDISFSAETFAHRRFMWHIAWDGFKERPLLGWGPENYIQVFDRHFDTRYYQPPAPFGAWFDRAHSIVFDYLVETGILGVLAYLSIFAALLLRILRGRVREDLAVAKRPALAKALALGITVAYLVQGLILFDVLPVHLNLFICFAFAFFLFEPPSTGQRTSNISKPHA